MVEIEGVAVVEGSAMRGCIQREELCPETASVEAGGTRADGEEDGRE